MKKPNYIQEMKNGYAVIIISPKKNYVPSLFWLDRSRENIISYNPCLGEIERNDLSFERLERHFENCEKEGCQVIVSGLINE